MIMFTKNLIPSLNKGVTRITLLKASCSQWSNKDIVVLQDFINRNPRSMELLRIARKPRGFCLDIPSVNYYYKLHFHSSQKYLSGWISHNNGQVVVSASTKEWAIRQFLYSAKDVCSAQNIGKVLAHRCLQAGIYEVHSELDDDMQSSSKIKYFVESMLDGGISLKEAPQILEKETYSFGQATPTFPWEVSEEDVERLEKEGVLERESVKNIR